MIKIEDLEKGTIKNRYSVTRETLAELGFDIRGIVSCSGLLSKKFFNSEDIALLVNKGISSRVRIEGEHLITGNERYNVRLISE